MFPHSMVMATADYSSLHDPILIIKFWYMLTNVKYSLQSRCNVQHVCVLAVPPCSIPSTAPSLTRCCRQFFTSPAEPSDLIESYSDRALKDKELGRPRPFLLTETRFVGNKINECIFIFGICKVECARICIKAHMISMNSSESVKMVKAISTTDVTAFLLKMLNERECRSPSAYRNCDLPTTLVIACIFLSYLST
jgi:hypothetical protein